MLRAARQAQVAGSVSELKLHRDVGWEADSPARPVGGLDTMA